MSDGPTANKLPYRPCVGIALFSATGLTFIGHRIKPRKGRALAAGFEWQMPQGGIDAGETPIDAARRELFEETNVRSSSLLGELSTWLNYDLPREAVGLRWRDRYRGQTQKWFAFRFDGDEAEINISRPAGGAHEPEFSQWRWESLSALPTLVVPFKRAVYERVAQEFACFAQVS